MSKLHGSIRGSIPVVIPTDTLKTATLEMMQIDDKLTISLQIPVENKENALFDLVKKRYVAIDFFFLEPISDTEECETIDG